MSRRVINIQFACDNAAFDSSPQDEIARILRDLADRVTKNPSLLADDITIRDLNGNRIGLLGSTGFSDMDEEDA
jgi:hypothetical protein